MSQGELLGVSVLELRTDDRALNAGLSQAERKVTESGQRMQRTVDQHLTAAGKSLSKTGQTLSTHLTLPIVALGAATADAAVKFQSSMEMIHTQAGATQTEVDKLSKSVLKLAETGKVAQGPQELAQGLFHLESIGLRGAKAMDALKIAAEGAAVGHAELEQTATALGSAWLVNIKGAGDLQHAMGVLNATVGAGNMHMQDLVDALGTGILPAAKLAGLSLQDVMGALAVFTDEGYQASSAAAQLGTALHFITSPTTKAAGALADIGLHSDQLAVDMHKPNGLLTALTDLKTHLDETFPPGSGHALSIEQQRAALERYRQILEQGGVTGKKLDDDLKSYKQHLSEYGSAAVAQEQTLNAMFPGGRGRILLTVLNQLDRYQMKLHQIDRTSRQFGQDVTATQQTASFKIHAAWSQVQADAIQFGDIVLPKLLHAGADVLKEGERVADAFFRLPKGAQDAIITGGLITAGIGPALRVLGAFSTVIGKAWGLGTILTKIGAGQGLGAFKSAPGRGGSVDATLGQLTGVRGAGIGSAINPLVVTLEDAQFTNLGSRAAAIGTRESAGASEPALAAGETRSSGGVILPAGVEAPAATGTLEAGAAGGFLASARGSMSTLVGRGMQGLLVGSLGVMASQAIGTAIHGSVGSAIRDIGTDASIGAGMGALFGPEGMAGGAIIGGLVGTFKHFFSSESVGQQVAGSLTKGFGGDQLRKQLAQALDDAHKQLQGTRRDNLGFVAHITLDASQLSGDKLAQYEHDMHQAGTLIAKQLEAGWSQYRFQDEPTMFTQFSAEVKKLPPMAQENALLSVVRFSRELESQGRLVKGSTELLLANVEQQFPGLVNYMGVQAGYGVQAFTAKLNFDQAEQNTKQAMGRIANHFASVRTAMDDTSGDTMTKAGVMVTALQGIVDHGTGPMQRQAKHDLAALLASLTSDFNQAGDVVESQMSAISGSVAKGSMTAASQAGKYWGMFAGIIHDAEQAGALTVAQGNKIIAGELAQALQALGVSANDAKKLASQGWSVGQVAGALASGTYAPPVIPPPGHAVGGKVTTPMYVVGEEAPAHPEYVLATNPAYRARNVDLWAQAGAALGIPGFAQGGVAFSGRVSTFGPPGETAGSTAYGKSSADPGISLRIPGTSWDDPRNRALMGHLFRVEVGGHSGSLMDIDLGPADWTGRNIDVTGAGARALGIDPTRFPTDSIGSVSELGAGAASTLAGAGSISAPSVKGAGLVSRIAQGALNKLASAANNFLTSQTASLAIGSGGPAGASGGGFDPGQLTTFDGLQVARWIVPELEWARQHGWQGSVTSGYRPPWEVVHGVFATAPQGQSEHRLDVYPGGAVDVSDYQQFAQIIRGYPGAEKLIQLPIDPLHFSGTGYARGGIIGSHRPPRTRPSKGHAGMPHKAAKAPSSRKPHFKPVPPLSTATPEINKALSQLNWLLGTDVPATQERYQYTSNLDDLNTYTFVVTQDPLTGQPIAPYIDQDAVSTRLGQLQQLYGWQTHIQTDLQQALTLIAPLLARIQAAIARRRAQIAALRARIQENLLKIAQLKKLASEPDPHVLELKKAINSTAAGPASVASIRTQLAHARAISTPAGKAGKSARDAKARLIGALNAKLIAAEHGAKVSLGDLRNQLLDVEAGDKQRKTDLHDKIVALESANQQLGGDSSKIGTGGHIGTLSKQITSLEGSMSSVQQDKIDIRGVSGIGGTLGDTGFTLAQLAQQIAPLSPGSLAQALAQATAQYSPPASTDTSQLASLLEQQLAQSQEALYVSQQQYAALGNLPPFAGTFHTGGIVPGPAGAERLALVQAGERITPLGGDGPAVHLHISGKDRWLEDLIDVRIERKTRSMAKPSYRGLPSSGGGIPVR